MVSTHGVVAIAGVDALYGEPMASESKPEKKKAEKSERPQKASRGDKTEEPRAARRDWFSWSLLVLALVFVGSIRGAALTPSPWSEILTVTQFLCPVAALIIFFKAYPHPIRTFNKKLARERAELEKEMRRKKAKRKGP